LNKIIYQEDILTNYKKLTYLGHIEFHFENEEIIFEITSNNKYLLESPLLIINRINSLLENEFPIKKEDLKEKIGLIKGRNNICILNGVTDKANLKYLKVFLDLLKIN